MNIGINNASPALQMHFVPSPRSVATGTTDRLVYFLQSKLVFTAYFIFLSCLLLLFFIPIFILFMVFRNSTHTPLNLRRQQQYKYSLLIELCLHVKPAYLKYIHTFHISKTKQANTQIKTKIKSYLIYTVSNVLSIIL